MGEHQIQDRISESEMRSFVRALLEDVRALEVMLERGQIESGIRRIGAEQEMFLIDRGLRPVKAALPLLEALASERFTTELGQFNLELNLSPQEFGGRCLSRLHKEIEQGVEQVRLEAAKLGVSVLLCGILPTLGKQHLSLDWMTPKQRYLQLNDTMCRLRGGEFKTMIKGVDELQTTHDNVMLEACNTSFQVHFQVGAQEFAPLYNLAQAVTAPVLAAGVNSPVLLHHRLWRETRVALFQQSLDVRSAAISGRGGRQRVNFGEKWVERSVMEIFREDIARFRALIAVDTGESPLSLLERGETPLLKALCLHNGTVYRWNRPCYGVKNGVAHLRIENRVLPAGPTVIDEVANAAFYFGLMSALDREYGDITRVMQFDHAKANFLAAARYGLDARFEWLEGRATPADQLILEHLLPLAREGLKRGRLDAADIDLYLGVLEERVRRHRTGAQWALDSLEGMGKQGTVSERHSALTAAMLGRQITGQPVHTWELGTLADREDDGTSYSTVDQVMSTDLFTVHPEDIIDLAANLMEWEHLHYVPVEDHHGHLVGLVTHRAILRMLAKGDGSGNVTPVAVREVMKTDPITVTPEASTIEAVELMRQHQVGCLPVVSKGRLVGIVTEHDFVKLASGLLDRWLRGR
jgi:CBS domain-containing protein/gamma-glutamylcysteine synthetase